MRNMKDNQYKISDKQYVQDKIQLEEHERQSVQDER